ncbi:MAG: hypothetical protein ACE5KM_18925 [Planctomycetaceae bacterium]
MPVFLLCLARPGGSMEGMLTISTDTLPQTGLSYVAFRVAFQETLERIVLAKQISDGKADCFGYLTEVPFLKAVAPHVQLDLLAETWAKHVSEEPFDATLVDESVVYAACETAARIADEEPEEFDRLLKGGPLDVDFAADNILASELRNLHLSLPSEGDFLLISQFEDLPPDVAGERKHEFGIEDAKLAPMFEVLGLWTMSADFLSRVDGLLNDREIVRAVRELGRKSS